jgi:pimeloyl-ACP methyl ester carboxylesterase
MEMDMTQYRNVSVGSIKASQLCAFPTTIHGVEADGVRVFYRAAGDTTALVVLLLQGFPTSSFMFREFAPRLDDNYRVIAPDLPGFRFTELPAERRYVYSLDGLAATIKAFTEELTISRFAVYVFDYGAPIGFRLAMAKPDRITAIVSQNGNDYEEGLGDAWGPIRRYWAAPTAENREVIRKNILTPSRWHGTWRPARLARSRSRGVGRSGIDSAQQFREKRFPLIFAATLRK